MEPILLTTFPVSTEASALFQSAWTQELNERVVCYGKDGSAASLMRILGCLLQGMANNEIALFPAQSIESAGRGLPFLPLYPKTGDGTRYLALLTRPCDLVASAAALPIRSILSHLADEELTGLMIDPLSEAVPVDRDFLLAAMNLYSTGSLQSMQKTAIHPPAAQAKTTFASQAAEAEEFVEELTQEDLYRHHGLNEEEVTLQVSRPMFLMDFDVTKACLKTLLPQDPKSYFLLGFSNPLADDNILSLRADRCGNEFCLRMKLALSGFDDEDSLLMEGTDFSLDELTEIFYQLGVEGKTSLELGLLDRLSLV